MFTAHPKRVNAIVNNRVYRHAPDQRRTLFTISTGRVQEIPFTLSENIIFDGENVIFDGEQLVSE